MAEFICEQCELDVEILGADGRHDEICDCGGKLIPLEEILEADRRADRFRLHETFRGG